MPLHQACYRLVGVLLFSRAARHFVADVHDPYEATWLRYDANANAAVGTRVAPPSGRVQHEGATYYPLLLAYVRMPPAG